MDDHFSIETYGDLKVPFKKPPVGDMKAQLTNNSDLVGFNGMYLYILLPGAVGRPTVMDKKRQKDKALA